MIAKSFEDHPSLKVEGNLPPRNALMLPFLTVALLSVSVTWLWFSDASQVRTRLQVAQLRYEVRNIKEATLRYTLHCPSDFSDDSMRELWDVRLPAVYSCRGWRGPYIARPQDGALRIRSAVGADYVYALRDIDGQRWRTVSLASSGITHAVLTGIEEAFDGSWASTSKETTGMVRILEPGYITFLIDPLAGVGTKISFTESVSKPERTLHGNQDDEADYLRFLTNLSAAVPVVTVQARIQGANQSGTDTQRVEVKFNYMSDNYTEVFNLSPTELVGYQQGTAPLQIRYRLDGNLHGAVTHYMDLYVRGRLVHTTQPKRFAFTDIVYPKG